MKLFIDLTSRRFVKSAASSAALPALTLKRRDSLALEIVFVQRGAAVATPVGTTFVTALKATYADANFLALAASGVLDLNTIPLEAAFASSPAVVSALLEVKWTATGEATRTATLPVEVQNSVILGTEATPVAMPDGKATQAQAEAGTDNDKWMTPLRTAQAILRLAATSWSSITGKPTEFPPSPHTHTIPEVTGLTTALDGKATAAQGAKADTALQPTPVDYRGAYDNGGDYYPGQVVSYGGELYVRIGEPNPGYPPGTSYWAPFNPSASPAFKLWVDLSKADAVHTHPATSITGLSSFIIASAPGLSINTSVRYGDGTSLTFPIDGLAGNDPEHVLVALNGVTQTPTTDYVVSEASGTITFDAAPAVGTQIAATALGLRSVQPPIDPTLYLFAFATSTDGLTTYSGRLLNAARPALPALPETATSWTVRRSTTDAAGRVLTNATATGSWLNRETLVFA